MHISNSSVDNRSGEHKTSMKSNPPPLRSSRARSSVRRHDNISQVSTVSSAARNIETTHESTASTVNNNNNGSTFDTRGSASQFTPRSPVPPNPDLSEDSSDTESECGRWVHGCTAAREHRQWRITDSMLQAYMAMRGPSIEARNDLCAWIDYCGRFLAQPTTHDDGVGSCKT